MSTAIASIVESPRAVKALEDAGYKTVEDLEGTAMSDLAGIKGVGQVTLETIRKQFESPVEEPVVEDEWEEGPHAIRLDSPYNNLALRITYGGTEQMGNRARPILPVFLRFEGGTASLTRKLYMLAKYQGNKVRARQALNDNEPWRVEAVEWLKNKPAFRERKFIILTD
jgi:hypothetical protein